MLAAVVVLDCPVSALADGRLTVSQRGSRRTCRACALCQTAAAAAGSLNISYRSGIKEEGRTGYPSIVHRSVAAGGGSHETW